MESAGPARVLSYELRWSALVFALMTAFYWLGAPILNRIPLDYRGGFGVLRRGLYEDVRVALIEAFPASLPLDP